jgi:ribonuclease HI
VLRCAPVKVVVNVDGGSRGNPGPAAVAAVVTDDSGGELTERAETIGDATNNVAEYRALLLGIQLAKELGADQVELVADSMLTVEQVRGNWKVKQEHLRPLRERVAKELADFDSWSIRHVRRDDNERADQLLNDALDAAA